MFSGLVGFIKPLLGKNTTETKQVAKVRSVDRDGSAGQESFKDIEDQVSIGGDHPERKKHSDFPEPNDEMKISIEGLIHMINETITDQQERQDLIRILERLKKNGVKSLPFDTTSSLIDQVKSLEG